MALQDFQYTSSFGGKRKIQFDPAALKNGFTPATLGFLDSDGTEVGKAVFRRSTRTHDLHTRMVGVKAASTGAISYMPVGTLAALQGIVSGETYKVTLKRGEVNNE